MKKNILFMLLISMLVIISGGCGATGSTELSEGKSTNSGFAGVNDVTSSTGTTTGAAFKPVINPVDSQPGMVTVKIAIADLPPGSTVGGITAHVIATSPHVLSIKDTDVSTATIGSLLMANTSHAADVILALININGIQSGEFAALNYQIDDGIIPMINDFYIAPGADIYNMFNKPIPDARVIILSVTKLLPTHFADPGPGRDRSL